MSLYTRRSRIVAFLAAALLLLSACGGGATEPTEAATPATTAEADTADATGDAPAVQASLLEGSFTTTAGETIDLANFQGQDVVLWYWAPW